jgi:hypothetical protein
MVGSVVGLPPVLPGDGVVGEDPELFVTGDEPELGADCAWTRIGTAIKVRQRAILCKLSFM